MPFGTIAAGFTALSTATTLVKSLRDGLKSGEIKPDEITGRIGEIYDYIIDSKAALVDSQEEIQRLRAQIQSFQDDKDFRESLKYDPIGVYRRKDSKLGEEIYCSTCLDADNKRVRTTEDRNTHPPTIRCHIHGYRYY